MVYFNDDLVILHKEDNELILTYGPEGLTETFLREIGIRAWSIVKYENFYGDITDHIRSRLWNHYFFSNNDYKKESLKIDLFRHISKECAIRLFEPNGFGRYKEIYDNLDYIYDCLTIKDIIE